MKILAEARGRPFKIDLSYAFDERCKKVLRQLFGKYTEEENPMYTYFEQEKICDFGGIPTNTHPVIEGYFFDTIPTESFGSRHIYSLVDRSSMSDEEYVNRKIQTYKELNWPDFKTDQDVSNLVGVHIRFTDNLNDVSKQLINTPIEVFMEKLKIIEKPFLLCSDNQRVIRDVVSMYGEENVILPNKVEDSDFQGLYEMTLLSNTKHIVGSYSSTFSYESAFFRGTSLEVYENGEWRAYLNKHM